MNKFFILFSLLFSQNLLAQKYDKGTYAYKHSDFSYFKQGGRNHKYNDAAFGSTVLRATDANDGSYCQVGYSYWPTFNRYNTKILVFCNGHPYIYNFDPVNFLTVGSKYSYLQGLPAGYNTNLPDDFIWSHVDNDVLYWHSQSKIFYRNFRTGAYGVVKDFTGIFPGQQIWSLSKSDDDNIFAFSRRSLSTGRYMGYVVWHRTKGITFNSCHYWNSSTGSCHVDEVKIDKLGNFLTIQTANRSTTVPNLIVMAMSDKRTTKIYWNNSHRPLVHFDIGREFMFGGEGWGTLPTFQKRYVSNPFSFSSVLTMPSWGQNSHTSMLASNERWGLVSTFATGTASTYVNGPFQNEIFQVSTTGSSEVRRIARHYSYIRTDLGYDVQYRAMPRANISYDGRYVAFSSNFLGRRNDVYIARIGTLAP